MAATVAAEDLMAGYNKHNRFIVFAVTVSLFHAYKGYSLLFSFVNTQTR